MPDSGTDPEGVDHKKLYDNVHAFTKDEIKCVMKYKCLKHLSCAVLYLYSQSIELGSIEQSIEYYYMYKVWGHSIASIRDLCTHSTSHSCGLMSSILVFHNVFFGITCSEMSGQTVNFHQIIHDLKHIYESTLNADQRNDLFTCQRRASYIQYNFHINFTCACVYIQYIYYTDLIIGCSQPLRYLYLFHDT